jgi:hypothetical protein
MSFTFKPSTPPAGVQANDGAGQPESRLPIQQFKGGGTIHGGEFTRNVHASANSGQPVRLPPVPPGARLKFLSESGQQIIGRNAGLHDRVVVPTPSGESSIGSALNAGVIVESASRSF